MTTDVLERVRKSIARGDLLAAHDLAMSAIADGGNDPSLRYHAVLSLARMGNAAPALRLYQWLGVEADAGVDAAALKGRLMKDLARAASGKRRRELFGQAHDAYLAAFGTYGGYFPAINAASTALLAGDPAEAARLARVVLAHPDVVDARDYYAIASGLEASILLEDGAGARAWFERSRDSIAADAGSKATTCRQLALVGQELPAMAEVTASLCRALGAPPVLAYTGHMFCEGDPEEASIRGKIDAALDRLGSTVAYGALACGVDILMAEAILARGGELNVVLPFRADDFLIQSVRPGGASWEGRFRDCLERAVNVIHATETDFVGDPGQFVYGTQVALGLASIRAAQMLTEAIQFAVVQPDARAGVAGAAKDVAVWAAHGRRTITIDPGPVNRQLDHPPRVAVGERALHSILFGDFAGFSRLTEAELPVFVAEVMGRIGAILDLQGKAVLSRNTWGDGLYAVIDSPVAAAEIALAQQEALRALPVSFAQHSKGAGMRIGVHHGPVFHGLDPVVGRLMYYGTEVTRTARIEPITPTGDVYVTQAFAAVLALEAPDRFSLEYVGKIKLAKGYGTLVMYRLGVAQEE